MHKINNDKWFIATKKNDVNTIKNLLKNNLNIEVRNKKQQTALHVATQHNALEVIELLIQHHCDLEAKDKEQRTALHIAAENGTTEAAEILIKNGSHIEAKMSDGATPIIHAVGNKKRQMVLLLLKSGAKVDAKDESGWSVMHWAAHTNDLQITTLLYQHKRQLIFSVLSNGLAPLHMAESPKMVKKLIALGTPVDLIMKEDQNTPLIEAVYQAQVAVAICLVNQGANILYVNEKGQSAFSLSKITSLELYSFFEKIVSPVKNKSQRLVRTQVAFEKNDTMALSLKKNGIDRQLIQTHASRRVDLFFYTLIAYYNSKLTVHIEDTHIQYGKGSRKNNTHACHSAILPSLWDTIHEEPSHTQNTRNNPGVTSYRTGILNRTHFEKSLNATVELDVSVNYFDSNYVESHSTQQNGMRAKALAILNQTSQGKSDPIKGLKTFLTHMRDNFLAKKQCYLDKENLKTSPKETRSAIYKAEFYGTFFNACGFNKEEEIPNKIQIQEDYIIASLPLSSAERVFFPHLDRVKKKEMIQKAYQTIKHDMDLPVKYLNI